MPQTVKQSTTKVFYRWCIFMDEKERMQTMLEIAYQKMGTIYCKQITEENTLRIRTDKWVKKYLKKNESGLADGRIKLISKNNDNEKWIGLAAFAILN